jgi:DNA gyrase subunit A
MDIVDPTNKNLALFNIGANGLGKRTELSKYKVQGRGGSGIKTAEVTDKTGYLVHAEIIDNTQAKDMDLIIMSHKGQTIRMPLASVSLSGRATQGVRLMRFKATDDHVAGVTILDNIEEKEE